MDLTTLQEFRQEIYTSFDRAGDGLFNTVDALISESQAQSFPELSLSAFFPRSWSSLYKAFKRGCINREGLQNIFIKYIPTPSAGKRLILGIDATQIDRPFSQTSPDRTAMPMHNIPHASPKKSTAITFGWKYSTMVVLPEKSSSWTYIVDQQRIPSDKTDIQVAWEQIKEIVPKLETRPLILLDRGYVSVWLWCQLSALAVDVLGRLKSNQCFYKPAPPHTKRKGQPRKDGAKLKLDNLSTQNNPDRIYDVTDEKGHPVSIRCWEHMHVKNARWLDLTIIQVIRPHARNCERDPKISWFVYIGQDPHDAIAQIALLYCLRFSQEHGYRFDKQALLWTDPRLQTPEQFDLWSQIVAIVHNHIILARDFIEGELRPWENKQRKHSPQQVRRGLATFLPFLGTPARPPKPRGKPKGRLKGTKLPKRIRFSVVRKKPTLPQLVST
jgi:DDE superfamily endonuclease